MSETEDELEEIRQRKREKLKAKLQDGADAIDLSTAEDDDQQQQEVPSEPIHVDGPDHFQEVLSSYDTVLVDFYADWCGPCKMLEPIVEDLAAETDAAVAKVDSDVHQGLATQYGVRGLPTLLLFSDGEVVDRRTGVQQKPQLQSMIQQHA